MQVLGEALGYEPVQYIDQKIQRLIYIAKLELFSKLNYSILDKIDEGEDDVSCTYESVTDAQNALLKL